MTSTNPDNSFRFAVAATFTADPLRSVAEFWNRQLHAGFTLAFAPYNQVLQSLLDPASVIAGNAHGVNALLLRLEDLAEDVSALEANVRHVAEQLRSASELLRVPTIVTLCPSVPGSAFAKLSHRMESLLEAALDDTPGMQLIPQGCVEKLYPVDVVHSPEGARLGQIPYTEAYFCALGTMLVRHTHALSRAPFKVIALDCDNTLWSGICGEDGPENVVLDAPRRALHEFMLGQREDGMVLTLASKNNEEDVVETFRVHGEMPLQLRHFVTWRLNWEPKSANLESIAAQLGLGLDSFLFVDDSPKECAELSDALPQVVALPLPENMDELPRFLEHVWAFDHPVVTEEDRKRSAYYAQAAEFGNEVRRARSMADFMASIQLRVTVQAMRPDQVPRVTQLTQRTNQFNTTTIRRTEADVAALAGTGTVLTAEVSDRFGDYGLVGAMFLQTEPGTLRVENMLLSCRALGRGVEHRMLAEAARTALAAGLRSVEVAFERTAKNKPALDFVSSLPSTEAAVLANLEWKPTSEVLVTEAPAPRAGAKPAAAKTVDYVGIATGLSTVPAILQAMRAGTQGTFTGDMGPTERELAAIWSELLGVGGVRREDNFFDLGGHSLVAVLLLMRIRETFGVELSIDDVYTGGLTLADLALRIEAAQAGNIDPAEYAALLAEIESLTDEEARVLLSQEDGPA